MPFSAITTGEADANSPADATLWGKVKDDFDDHESRVNTLEGKLVDYTVGDYYIQKNDTERSTQVTSYTKLKEIKLDKAGSIRTKFSMKANDSGAWAYGKVYRNGAAVGTQQSTNSTTPVEFSEDISGWSEGDLYQIYGYANVGTNTCYISDQKVCVVTPGTVPGAHNSY